jgi:DNA (cytosine-5)-methyltransferase 1
MSQQSLTAIDVSAGAGGLVSGLDEAGFTIRTVVTHSATGAKTIRKSRPGWTVIDGADAAIDGDDWYGVDLVSGTITGLPSDADGQPAHPFGTLLEVVDRAEPAAVFASAAPELASPRFARYREGVIRQLEAQGYRAGWQQFDLSRFGVPQDRSLFVLIAGKPERFSTFAWPAPITTTPSVGQYLYPIMAERGWPAALFWASRAFGLAPRIAAPTDDEFLDMGSNFTKGEWHTMAVDGWGIADASPAADASLDMLPQLSLTMIARLQGFRHAWWFVGSKAEVFHQIAGEFPPVAAASIGAAIASALQAGALITADFGQATASVASATEAEAAAL